MTIEEAIRAALIAEYDAIPPKEELEKMYTFSERHERQMAEIFANLDKFDEKCRRRNLVRKIAIILVVVLAVTIVSVKFVPEVYAFVKEWLMETKEDRIRFEGKSSEKDARAVEELRFELGYVPDGYELVSEEYTKTGTYQVSYRHNEGMMLFFECYGKADDNLIAINTEGTFMEMKVIDGIMYYLLECDLRENVVIWEKEGKMCKIKGVFGKKELMDIAISTKEK